MPSAVLKGFFVSALFGATTLVSAAASAVNDPPVENDKTLSPYFFIENGDASVDRLPLAGTKVDVTLSGSVADVTVTQSYTNEGKRPINAKYVFPASTRAAVHGMKMTIGKHVITAKIKEREQAKQEFEAHKKEGKNATLLEEDRPNVFSMSVANIMPGDHIDVTLDYTELLVPLKGTYEFVYPTVVGPRYSNKAAGGAGAKDKFVETPYLHRGNDPTSTFELTGTLSSGIPVAEIASPSHKMKADFDNPNLARFALEDGERRGNNRDFILRYGLRGDSIQSGLSLYDAGDEKFFSLVVEPPKRVAAGDVPAREYVFVLDVSGSMEGFPLDTAKSLLRELVKGMRPVDRFNVLLFSGTSYLWSPESLAATPENVTAAVKAIERERGGGGTELLPALQRALGLKGAAGLSRTIVVVTDGYIEADKGAIDLVREHLGEANVFAFGIGGSVNRYLIEGIAKAGQGEPGIVTDPKGAPEAGARFREYISAPVLTKIRVKYDGFDASDVEPSAIPDVFAERPVVVHGKWRGAPSGTITLEGVSAKGTYAQRFDVARATPKKENKALRYLWARQRIADLSDFGFGEPDDATKKAVTVLGLRYSLLTRYTSFIAVSEIVRNTTGGATDAVQPLPLPVNVSESAVGGGMDGAAEPELVVLALMVAMFFGGLAVVRKRREGFAS
jgi:Ca-activated chloride channel family protein